MKHPKTSDIKFGDTISLSCIFSSKVNECFWLRHGNNVEILDRYQYIDDNNGYNTTDCSLIIISFQEIDVGDWMCGSISDEEGDVIVSETAYLYHINNGKLYLLSFACLILLN